MALRCFWCEPTGTVRRYLKLECGCGHEHLVHMAPVTGVDVRDPEQMRGLLDWATAPWPTQCEGCGREFDDLDAHDLSRSSGTSREWRRTDTGEIVPDKLPPGAMYDSFWYEKIAASTYDGRAVVVILPAGTPWCVDGRASNCDRPNDAHHCWVRHGEPPDFTADKLPQEATCSAGAGSIWEDKPNGWHGYLRDGRLVEVGEV